MKAPAWTGIIIVVLLLALAWAFNAKQDAERQGKIAAENAQAALDTVRVLRVGRQKDSVAYVQSLQQVQLRLEGALRDVASRERLVAKLRADFAARARPVDTVLVGSPPMVDSVSGTLVGRLDLAGPPITGHVSATLAPRQPSQWDVHLQPDPIPLTVVVGCRKDGPPAISVLTPDWATVQLGTHNQVSPDVCHPRKTNTAVSLLTKAGLVLIGYGLGSLTH